MYHYTYILLDPESEMKYIGMRSSECKPEEDTYMGSSYAMTIHDKRRCDKLVLEEFDTREEALQHEIKLHNQFEVHTNPEFWNLSKQTSTKFISNRKGCKLTEEHKRKCSEALKGRKMPEFTEEHKRKISEAKIGIKASVETRKKMSDSRQGEDNSNFKHKTVYKWYKDNEYFVGTVGQLAMKCNIKDKSALYRAIKGKTLTGNGWLIVQNVDTNCSTTGIEYIVKYQWHHTDGSLAVKNCYEMSKFLEEKFENNVKKVIRGTQKSIKGWKIESIVETETEYHQTV